MSRSRAVALAILIAIVVAACAGPGPTGGPSGPVDGSAAPSVSASAVTAASIAPVVDPTPAATDAPVSTVGATTAPPSAPAPTRVPTPTPAPVDPAAAFVTIVRDPAFSTRIAISGESRVGRVATTTTGTVDVDAGSRHLVATSTTGRSSTTLDTVSTPDARYRSTDGVWVANGAPANGDLVAALRGATTVTSVGVEEKDGRQLTHLVLAPPAVLPAEIAPAGRVSKLQMTLDAWVEDNGTPVLLTVGASWHEKSGRTTVAATASTDFAFSDVDGLVSVTAPTDLWTFSASRHYAYRMAHPVDWQYEKGTKKYTDAYYGFDGTAVYVASGNSFGLTLNRLSSAVTTYLPQIKGVKHLRIDHNSPAKLGPLQARRIEFHYAYKGKRYWSVAYLAVKGRLVYLVSYDTLSRTTDAHRAMAARFAGTFSPL